MHDGRNGGRRGERSGAPRVARLLAMVALALLSAGAVGAETRLGVTVELLNALSSGAELEGWTLLPAGDAQVSIRNVGSRQVRSELVLRVTPAGAAVIPSLERLYVRATFGEVLATVGKTRSSWGSGLALNAGDIIFGSSSLDFSLRASDPRSQTAWLAGAEIPFGDFSFVELIALPGEPDLTNPLSPALPALEESSAGGRVNLALGDVTAQAGYLFRGDTIAGLGATGHHAYVTVEGYLPVNWHVSVATRTPRSSWDQDVVSGDLVGSAGAYGDVSLPRDRRLGWQFETLVRPFQSFAPTDGATPADYGLFLYPGLTLSSGTGMTLSVSSVVSPIDLSARLAAGFSWNIYETLTLLSYLTVAAGESDNLFSMADPSGVSILVGGRYVF